MVNKLNGVFSAEAIPGSGGGAVAKSTCWARVWLQVSGTHIESQVRLHLPAASVLWAVETGIAASCQVWGEVLSQGNKAESE